MTLLSAQNLGVTLSGRSVLCDVSLSLERGHLVALVGAPFGKFNFPVTFRGGRGGKMMWQLAGMRFIQHALTTSYDVLLSRREVPV